MKTNCCLFACTSEATPEAGRGQNRIRGLIVNLSIRLLLSKKEITIILLRITYVSIR